MVDDPARGADRQEDTRALPTRRQALVGALAAAGAAALDRSSRAEEKTGAKTTAAAAESVALTDGNPLERMRAELVRALDKPVEQRHWVMVIDLQKCIGCRACTVSCVAENNLPPGVVYRPVVEEELGEFPHVRKRFTPRPCMQCADPPCTDVCPVGATYARPDGIVAVDYETCIGCRYCLAACPYNARTADFGEFYGQDTPEVMAYETRPRFEYGKEWKREPGHHDSPVGNAHKCHFCLHRIENAMLPACVTTCLGGATYFGDYNDPQSLVHELVGSTRATRLKEELGTDPMTYYLV